jgi:uncharacterized protein (TIRG00374 family)
MFMRWLRLIISFGVSLLLLYLTFYVPRPGGLFDGRFSIGEALFGRPRFDLAELGRVIVAADWRWIGLTGLLFFVSLGVRAWRWRVMLTPLVPIRFSEVFSAMCIGYMANNVLPLRMGEVYRAHVVYQMTGLSRSAAFGAVVLERATDLLFMIPYMGLGLLLFPLPGFLQKAAYVTGVAAIGFAAFLVWLAFDRSRALGIAHKVLGVLPKRVAAAGVGLLEKFAAGLGVIEKSEHHLGLVISSLLLWALYAGMVFGVLCALHFIGSGIELIDRNPLGAVVVTLIITTVGFSMPSAPGAVGTYHGVAVLGLSLFGVPGDRAAGFAVLLHALNYVPLTVLGLIFFWKLGLSFRDTRGLAVKRRETAVEDPAGVRQRTPQAGSAER